MNRLVNDATTKASTLMEGGIKRLGALFLKSWAVLMIPIGVGLMLYGIMQKLEHGLHFGDPFPFGVTLVILGALLWMLGKRLDAAAQLVRYRRQQNRVLRLASERGGRLTVTEAATETGMAAEEAEEILKKLAEGGFVEIEVTDSGLMVYRFPEIVHGHEKHWSRGLESA